MEVGILVDYDSNLAQDRMSESSVKVVVEQRVLDGGVSVEWEHAR